MLFARLKTNSRVQSSAIREGVGIKSKQFRHGSIYMVDLFESMFLIEIEATNLEENLTKVFVYTESSKQQQRANAIKFFSKARKLLAKKDTETIRSYL